MTITLQVPIFPPLIIIYIGIEQLLGADKIESIEVVSQVKTENVAVINFMSFRAALSELGVIPYGEDLDDGIQTLLQLSSSCENLIMIRKLKKCIADIKKFKYFTYFGHYFREEEAVDSDFEKENDKANKTKDKLEQQVNQNLKLNNKSMVGFWMMVYDYR